MEFNTLFKKPYEGIIEEIGPEPSDPDHQVLLSVRADGQVFQLMVPKTIVEERKLRIEDAFSWWIWKWTFLDIYLNGVQDVTEDYPPNKSA